MQVFEFLFNPDQNNNRDNNKENKIFDSFCYEPENIREKKLGSLYIIGEVINYNNIQFLNDLAVNIKEKYYHINSKSKAKSNPEKKLKEALKETNNFLQNRIKQGDDKWLNNLNLAILNLTFSENQWELNFTKIGDIKILLIREGHLSDIGQSFKSKTEKENSSPLFTQISSSKILTTEKFFENIATGRLSEYDRIAVLTKNVFTTFEKGNIFQEISELSLSVSSADNQNKQNEEKKLKIILKKYKRTLLKISGTFFLITLDRQKGIYPQSAKGHIPLTHLKKEIFKFENEKIAAYKENFKKNINKLSQSLKLSIKRIKLPKISKPAILIKKEEDIPKDKPIPQEDKLALTTDALEPTKKTEKTVEDPADDISAIKTEKGLSIDLNVWHQVIREIKIIFKNFQEKINIFLDKLSILKQKILNLFAFIRENKNKIRLNYLKNSFYSIFQEAKLKLILKTKKVIFHKNTILVVAFILTLVIGSWIFDREKINPVIAPEEFTEYFQEIENKITQAENFLIIDEEEQARALLQEALEKTIALTESTNIKIREEALLQKKLIEDKLNPLNKVEKIENPLILYEFKPGDFNAQNIFLSEKNIYLFDAQSNNLAKLEQNNLENLNINKEFDLIDSWKDSILIFKKPDKLIILKNKEIIKEITLNGLDPDFNPKTFSTYYSNLYFLDNNKGRIIKVPSINSEEWDTAQNWLESEKLINAKSISVGSSIRIINRDNKIDHYYRGDYQSTINPNISPAIKNIEKISNSINSSHLYLLEPSEKRIIILDNKGGLVKQLTSEKFSQLIDLDVSDDGKTIWLLDSNRIYKIEI